MGRALAHGKILVGRFSDPTAFTLLSDAGRARVERARSAEPPKGLKAAFERGYLIRNSKVMVARTVAIDDAIRAAGSAQLVILGAGLDGRAFRMPELRDVTVFEVDHPDSQREKRARVSALPEAARDVRFVPVDFARDDLDASLAKAGHDPARTTTWVWEGVVMYLAPADIEATLAVISRRSAVESQLVILYHSPALLLRLVGLVVRRMGEPLKSAFSAGEMRAMLAKHGFAVSKDEDIHQIGSALSEEIRRATSVTRHMRIVTAEKLPSA